jgi:uncharacterized membrane protein YfcA
MLFVLSLFGLFAGARPQTRRDAAVAGGAGRVADYNLGSCQASSAPAALHPVPFMTWCNVPMHHAVATSAAFGLPLALSNTIGYVIGGWSIASGLPATLGYLWLPALAVIASASVLTAPLGARTAHRLNVRQLQRAFAFVLYALAAYMLHKGWAT